MTLPRTMPGGCDHCERDAVTAFCYWDGGAPGVGEYQHNAQCDYHLGDPPGSIPGRCWTCGKAFTADREAKPWPIHTRHIAGDGAETVSIRIANFHPDCTDFADLPRRWTGPRQCTYCFQPIAYGEDYNAHHQRFKRTLYSHRECP